MFEDLRTLRVEIADRVATVTLQDADRRNAISLRMVEEMGTVFDGLEASAEVGAVVVTGEPPAFCAGADLSHLGDAAREGLLTIYEGFLRVARSTLPTVAAVNGAAVGAGMNLALACDLRLATESARFDCRFLDLGLHPGGGHTWMLRQIGGAQLVTAMVLFGQRLDGREAVRRGLVWEVTTDEDLLPRARAVAGRAAAAPPELATRLKDTLREMATISTHEEAVTRELEPQVWSIGQPSFAERLAALRERIRRTP